MDEVRADAAAHETVSAWFDRVAERHASRPAIRDASTMLTYSALRGRADALAQRLRESGVRPGHLVGICVPRSADLVVAVVGVNRAGACYVPLDVAHPLPRLREILRDAGVRVVVGAGAPAGALGSGVELIAVPERAAPAIAEPAPRDADDPAYVIYTSGSTGSPKGVVVTNENLSRLFTATRDWYRFDHDDVWPLFHSIAFDVSVWELWGTLLHGGLLTIPSHAVTRSPAKFHELVIATGVTVLNQTPTAFRSFLGASERAGWPKSRLRLVLFAGEALHPASLREWIDHYGDDHPRLVNMYGITEVTVHAMYRRIRGEDCEGRAPSVIGAPFPDLTVRLIGADGAEVATGDVGEIHVSGSGVAAGYLRRPQLTRSKFIETATPSGAIERTYRSGDLARRLPDGDLEYIGRVDHQVKVRGFRVELGEIESTLASSDDVGDTTVLLRTDMEGEPRLVAYYVPQPGAASDAATLRELCEARLPDYMVPSAFVRLHELPRTVNDKLDRAALPLPQSNDYARGDGGGGDLTPNETTVARLFERVLGIQGARRNDNFFRLGGSSIDLVRFSVLCAEELGVQVSVGDLLRTPVLRGIARLLDRATATAETASARRDTAAPFSPQQRALWIELCLRGNHDAYNVSVELRVDGPIDSERLRSTLVALAESHEALRACVIGESDAPRIAISDEPRSLDFEITTGTNAASEARSDAIGRPLDLRAGMSWRSRLLVDDDGNSAVVLVVHHMLCDADSMEILLDDLIAAYDSQDFEPESTTCDLLDVCERERHSLSESRSRLERFWSTQLRDAQAVGMELPTALSLVATAMAGSASLVSRPLPVRVIEGAHRLARAWAVTPFHVYLAAFLSLLRVYAGQETLTVGIPVTLRDHPSVQRTVAYMINPVPFQVTVAGDQSFEAATKGIARLWRRVHTHARLPMDLVFRAARQAAGRAAGSDVGVYFSHRRVLSRGRTLAGHAATTAYPAAIHAKFPMFVEFLDSPESLEMRLEARQDTLGRELGRQFLRQLEMALDAATNAPDTLVAELCRAPDDSRPGTGETPLPCAVHVPAMTIVEAFRQVVDRHAGSAALVESGQRVSYAELDAASNAVARSLLEAGASAGTRVALVMPRSARAIACTLGVLKAGAVYVPIDAEEPEARLRRMLDTAQCEFGFSEEPLDDAPHVTWLDSAVADQVRAQAVDACVASANDPAYIMFTSGSTGAPKGVVVPHRAVVRLVRDQWFARMGSDETWLHMAPTSFDASTLEMWAPLLNGGCCVVLPDGLPSPAEMTATIAREQITSAWITSSLFNALIDESPSALAGLRQLLVGGEALSPPHVRRALRALPATTLINGYGPTENTTFTCCHVIQPSDVADDHAVPIGRPIRGTTVYVLDLDGNLAPTGVPGELVTGGDGVALGYAGDDALTAERFVPDPFSPHPASTMYRTGDRARWRADGTLEFMGRLDDQVKIRGYRIEPGELEAVLLEHAVLRSAVVTVDRPGTADARLIAHVVPQHRGTAKSVIANVEQHVRSRLPAFLQPAAIHVLPQLPVTPTGKVDRQALCHADQGAGGRAQVLPTNDVERRVAEIWSAALGVRDVSMDDDFFASGGHSLIAVRMAAAIEAEFGGRFDFQAFFANPSPSGIAATLPPGASTRAHPEIIELRPGQGPGTLFCLPGLGGHVFSFQDVARKLTTDVTVVGLQTQELDRYSGALSSMSAMAATFIDSMLTHDAHGPHYVLGYSFGGNLAAEIAHQLELRGKPARHLFMLDAYAPGAIRAAHPLRKAVLHTRELLRQTPRGAARYIGTRILRRTRRAWLRRRFSKHESVSGSVSAANRAERVRALCLDAASAHTPVAFSTPLTLVRVTRYTDWTQPDSPVAAGGWTPFATAGLHEISIDCEHLELLTEPHVTTLAAAIDDELRALRLPPTTDSQIEP